jgi:hypothetical protein
VDRRVGKSKQLSSRWQRQARRRRKAASRRSTTNAGPAIWPFRRCSCRRNHGRRSWLAWTTISDPDTAKQITDYLVANAAEPGSPVLRGLDLQAPPLRITETRIWQRIHHEIRPTVFDRPDIKSKSNCLACHGGGARAGGDD